ncbi:hypothetical protein [Methylobacterium sp. JK268]
MRERFGAPGLPRIVPVITRTNPFNLTIRRDREVEGAALIAGPRAVGLQLQRLDRFGCATLDTNATRWQLDLAASAPRRSASLMGSRRPEAGATSQRSTPAG